MELFLIFVAQFDGSVAQSVEQRIEAPCVGSSILSRAIIPNAGIV